MFLKFDRVRVNDGPETGNHGTVVSRDEGSDGEYCYGVKLDCHQDPIGFSEHELCHPRGMEIALPDLFAVAKMIANNGLDTDPKTRTKAYNAARAAIAKATTKGKWQLAEKEVFGSGPDCIKCGKDTSDGKVLEGLCNVCWKAVWLPVAP